MRQIHGILLVLLLATFVVWAVGCSSDDESPTDPGGGGDDPPYEPVTEEIISSPEPQRNPSYSPNGTWIVYEVAETDKQGDHDLYKVLVADGEPDSLTWGDYFDTEPSWSDDGDQVVFESNRPQAEGDYKHIWVIDIEATDGMPTALTSGAFHDGSPVWSGDGSYIVFVSNRGGNDDLWLMAMNEGVPGITTQLTTVGAGKYARSPDWSPDSGWVVFESNAEGTSALYKVAVTGGDAVRLTGLPGYEGHPSWSPNAEYPEIAYEATRNGMTNIWVVDAEDLEAEPFQVTEDGGNWPTWHPDGSLIIYGISDEAGADEGVENIWTVEVSWH